jgi:multicomponent Na+:H+ antiporter subunit E
MMLRVVVRILLRPWRLAAFLVLYLWDLIVANAVVAWEVITPEHAITPGIVRVPVHLGSDLGMTILANLISFTPGTLTLEVDEERSLLYVHALHMRSPDAVRRRVARLERRLSWVVGG